MLEDNQKNATPEQRAVVNFLRSKAGPKIRSGLLNGKRTDYFKGKSAVKALLSPAYAKVKKAPKVEDEEQAYQLLHTIVPCAFFLRVNRSEEGSPRTLSIMPQQAFPPDGLDYYAWFYEGSQFWTMLAGYAMVAVMLTAVMFPLWPYTLRLGVWYLSMGVMGLLGAFFAMAILRLVFYVVTLVVAKPGIWVFPRLFEDVSFMDSWTPLWGWDIPPKKKKSKDGKSGSSSSKSSGKSKKTKAVKGEAVEAQTTAMEGGAVELEKQRPLKGATIEELVEGEDED